jgi:hypothetical protein
MNTEVSFTEPPVAIHSVEFYPSIDDHVYVSLRIGEAAVVKTWSTHLYNLFLLANAIAIPAFLLLIEYKLAAALIFLGNLIAVLFLVPRVNADSNRKFYEKIYGNRENKIARADLRKDGLFYSADGCYSFFAWHRIERIEESDEAIYFFVDGNGFGIRKNGFPYLEAQKAFLGFARENIRGLRSTTSEQS